jgi:hypothetical protein
MTMRSWIRKLFAGPVAHPIRKRRRRTRLAIEALEQRWVPSFTVTNLLDDGSVGSLRWAVGQANTTGGDQTIDFNPIVFGTPQTITLSGTQLELTDTTGTETIVGPAVGVTVNGNNRSRVFQIDGGVSASISGLTITGGHNEGRNQGGGIFNSGTLTLTNCTVSGNNAGSGYFPFQGGGIFNSGTLTLTNCTVSGNSSIYGGGIFNGGTATLTDCTVSGNSASLKYGSGGGILNGGTLTLANCTVSGNSASYFGGGVDNNNRLSMTNCTVTGNSAGSGGGGIGGGGGLFNTGSATLTNCTVSGNSASGLSRDGGGILNSGTLTLTDCTVSGNSAVGGGGIRSYGTLTLANTIVAGNSVGNVFGSFSGTYNLIGGNPMLAPLGNYGGPTQTMALLPGSPAIDAGDPAQLGVADQRGVVRSGSVNIGAYQASATAFLVGAPDAVQSGVPFDVTVTAVDPFGQVAVGYTGTVTFSTTDTDPGVVLPADYAFVPGDGGMHRFTDTGLREITLITSGDQMFTVMDTADNTITGSADLTVIAGAAPHGQRPPPSTVPAQGAAPTPSQSSVRDVVGLQRWLASFHDGDSVGPTVPRLRHQARGDTTPGMADLFGGDDLLFARAALRTP